MENIINDSPTTPLTPEEFEAILKANPDSEVVEVFDEPEVTEEAPTLH